MNIAHWRIFFLSKHSQRATIILTVKSFKHVTGEQRNSMNQQNPNAFELPSLIICAKVATDSCHRPRVIVEYADLGYTTVTKLFSKAQRGLIGGGH